ncbi:MAG TPA: glycosyltransferase 87 family protein [Streptosporangiaceae bacterium]
MGLVCFYVSTLFRALPRPGQARGRWLALLIGVAALVVYLVPRLLAPRPQWPMWDVNVYWWGGTRALHDATLYAAHEPRSFTYPPFAAALFGLAGGAPEIVLKVSMVVLSLASLGWLAWLSIREAGWLPRPEWTVAVTTLALLLQPVMYTLHLGEVNLILAALIAADLLRRHDGAWWQGIATGVAAGVKLTPLIFVAYLLVTRRPRAAAAATLTFAGTVAAGFVLLPGQSHLFWLRGVFLDQRRIGNNFNPANQSLAGMMARLGGGLPAVRPEWIAAALLTGAGGLAVAALLHRRGQRLAGLACCGLTGVLVSPISWTHHWVWLVPLLVALAAAAWRRRSLILSLATVALFAAFANLDPMPWPGPHPSLLRTLAGNLYVLCGLAVLVAAALFLARNRTRSRRHRRPHPPARRAEPVTHNLEQ